MTTIIDATVMTVDLLHPYQGGVKNTYRPRAAYMRVRDVQDAPGTTHPGAITGWPTFEWMNSGVDEQASRVKPGDRVRIELNANSIPLHIAKIG